LQASYRGLRQGERRGICFGSGVTSSQEHDMPNRSELAIPAPPADFGAKDAWMVIGFCAIGWLMSISLAASLLGAGALPKFPWG
jgi:hypothetical protein